MAETNYNDKMIAYAQEQGWLETDDRDLNKLDASQYLEAAKKVRPKRQLAKDARAAVTSRAMTTIGLRVVPDEVARANEAKCRACPHKLFGELRNGEPVCHQCNCSDKYLRSKWRDAAEKCPKGVWNNQKVTETTPVAGEGVR